MFTFRQVAGLLGTAWLAAAGPAQAEELRINGPTVFGVRPGSPFLYRIPAVGDKPLAYSAESLPAGLTLDPASGMIRGRLAAAGEFPVTLVVRQGAETARRPFRIIVGEKIGLTPAMGWNSWNCWATSVDQAKVLKAAAALSRTGLINHGWTYVNIDDTWQGLRSAQTHALQSNEKFPDMRALCERVHVLGLKVGIYSTPWITSYAGLAGGTSDAPDGAWKKAYQDQAVGRRFGRHSFADADARQWADWGMDYLKYDWRPNDVPHVREMALALRHSGRDIVYSLSNAAPIAQAADWAQWANSWRTTGDIRDVWTEDVAERRYFGISEIGFAQDPWAPFTGPGHFSDPDMLVLGQVGWKSELRPTRLTHDEQLTHFSLWCLLSAPLLLGCDLDRLDDFTMGILTNDAVIALDQDALGAPATRVATVGAVDVYLKRLEDGATALGFFNRADAPTRVEFGKLGRIGLEGAYRVRDLWHGTDLPDVTDTWVSVLNFQVPAHGVCLYRLTPKS